MDKGTIGGIDPDQCAPGGNGISVLWNHPEGPARAGLILAHGAGAPMESDFMTQMADALAARGIVVARFEFAYMASRRMGQKKRPPDPQASLLAQWHDTYKLLAGQLQVPVAIGGKSMGGRMASLLADELKPTALICLGYPFHPAGKPDKLRVAHLTQMGTPTLIVQGERDPLGNRTEVESYCLSSAVSLYWLAEANHDFVPLKRTGLTQQACLALAADRVAEFLLSLT